MKTIEIWKKNIVLLILLGLQMLKICMCAYWQEHTLQNNVIFENEITYTKILTMVISDLKEYGWFSAFPFSLLYIFHVSHVFCFGRRV